MKLHMFTCARWLSIDQQTNALSLFDITTELFSPVFPYVVPSLTAVAVTSRKTGERDFDGRMVVKLGDDVIANGPFPVRFGPNPFSRTMAEIANLTLPGPGLLKFELTLDEENRAAWHVLVLDSSEPLPTTVRILDSGEIEHVPGFQPRKPRRKKKAKKAQQKKAKAKKAQPKKRRRKH